MAINVLIVTPYLPYPDAPHATSEVVFRFIYHFSQRHRIFLASMYESFEQEKLNVIGKYVDVVCAVMSQESSATMHLERQKILDSGSIFARFRAATDGAMTLLTHKPRADEVLFISKTLEQISRLAPDIIQVETAHLSRLMSQYLEGLPAVAVAHDVDMKPARRRFEQEPMGIKKLIYYSRYRLLSLVEPRVYRCFKRVYTMSSFDKMYLQQRDSSLRVSERPSIFMLPETVDERERNSQMILFVGAMHREENIEAVEFFISHILPLVQKTNPRCEFHLVGGGAPERLRRLHDGKTIFIHGFVPSAMPYFQRARVMVAPMLVGGGMIMKVFYALYYGLPTVASPIANEGIGAEHEKSIFLAQTPDEFARFIQTLLSDDARWTETSLGAKEFISKRFNQAELLARIEADYAEIISQQKK